MPQIKIKYPLLFFIILISSYLHVFSLDKDVVFNAMRDEINRTMNNLSIETLKKPYYIEYSLTIREGYVVKASLGSLQDSESTKSVLLSVGIRVGNYKFDNTNFFDVGLNFFGSSDDEESFKNRSIPIEIDYNSLRRDLWLATDAAYKQASEIYSKKEAAISNRLRKDTTPDFSFCEPRKLFNEQAIPSFDKEHFTTLVKKLSSVFIDYPEINVSSVGIEYLPETTYYLNSEGIEYVNTELYAGLEIAATTQAKDGMPLSDFFTAFGLTPYDFPKEDSLMNGTKLCAENLRKMMNSSTLDEPYSGPVLFEGQAAAEVLAQVFAPNVVAQRAPMSESGMQENDRFAAFQSKIGGRVLPEFLSLKDLPDMKDYENTKIIANYTFDDDGVPAKEVILVRDGYLKNLLSSRIPVRRVKESNGHKRGGAPIYSNLMLESDNNHLKPISELKARLLELCKDRELPFGIIIRKLMDQNLLYTTIYRMTQGIIDFPRGEGKISIIKAYKIFPDGREELIRGCEASGFTVQSFKDIILAGNKNFAYNFLTPSVVSPFISGGNQYLPCSIIVPDLLFDDGEIKPLDEDFRKPPVLANPLLLNK